MLEKIDARIIGTFLRLNALKQDGFSITEVAQLSDCDQADVEELVARMLATSEIEIEPYSSREDKPEGATSYKLTNAGRNALLQELSHRTKPSTSNDEPIVLSMERAELTVIDAVEANEEDQVDLVIEAKQEFAFCERSIEVLAKDDPVSAHLYATKLSKLRYSLDALIEKKSAVFVPTPSPRR